MMAANKTMQCKRWVYLACVLLPMGASVACAPVSPDSAVPMVRERVEASKPQPAPVPSQQEALKQARVTPAEPVQQRSQPAISVPGAPTDDVVYFRFDSIELSAQARRMLEPYVQYAKSSGARLRMEGHTDERGTREYNLALAQLRAEFVAQHLVLRGVPRTRLDPVSLGEEAPAELGSNERAWARNRRVQIIVLDGSGGTK